MLEKDLTAPLLLIFQRHLCLQFYPLQFHYLLILLKLLSWDSQGVQIYDVISKYCVQYYGNYHIYHLPLSIFHEQDISYVMKTFSLSILLIKSNLVTVRSYFQFCMCVIHLLFPGSILNHANKSSSDITFKIIKRLNSILS